MKTIEIPDDIDSLDLAVQDKIALATMRKRPRIGNGALARLLGISDSGVRTMIRRFRAAKLVKEFKIDGTREFRVTVGDQGADQALRQKVTKTGTPEIRQKVTGEPPPGLTAEERAQWKRVSFIEELRSVEQTSLIYSNLRMAGFYSNEYDKIAQRIGVDPDLPEADRQRLCSLAEKMRNVFAAANYVGDYIPDRQKPHVLKAVKGATSEQLARFYDYIQAGNQLGAGGAAGLLTEFDGGKSNDVNKVAQDSQTASALPACAENENPLLTSVVNSVSD